MPRTPATDAVLASINRTLRQQAQRNELVIAQVRLLLIAFGSATQWVGRFLPRAVESQTPLPLALFTTGYVVFAAGLVLLLRRGAFPPWLPLVTPALDAIIVVVNHVAVWHTLVTGPPSAIAISTFFAVVCSIVVAGGALRMTRLASAETSLLGAGAFVVGSLLVGALNAWAVTYGAVLMVVLGLFSWRMTAVVRRAVQSEIGRQTLRRFLPESVIESAHADPMALLSQPRSLDATVLVSDLRGFTAISESLSPAQVLELLNELQGELARVVQENRGTVDKFMGDGMLAVFGAPLPLADHAVHALRAAGGIRDALARVNEARTSRSEAPVALGMGIHSGDLVAGCLGGAERMEFTIIGDAVNTASRLESLTKEKQVDVLVSGETVRRLGGTDGLRSLGPVSIRGKSEPIEIFALAADAHG